MTNEQAIHLLHRLKDEQFDGVHGDERREALEMAIRAMEEPKTAGSGSVDSEQPEIKTDRTTGDCISRQQAIEGLYDVFFDDELKAAYPDKADVVLDVIRKLSTVQPEVLDCGSGELVKDSQRLVEASSNDMISRQQAIEAFEPTHHTDWYTPTIIKTLEELPQAQQDKSCKGCYFEKHGSRACDHCSRMYMDRYEVKNDG